MKKMVFILLLSHFYLNAQEIDLANYEKYRSNFSITLVRDEQIVKSEDFDLLENMMMLSWNHYRIDDNGGNGEPSYCRLLIFNNYERYEFRSFFCQFQGKSRWLRKLGNINASYHMFFDNREGETDRKYGIGIGTYKYWERLIDKNRKFTFDIAANIFPLTSNNNSIIQTATFIPQLAFVVKKVQATLELFTYLTYDNKEVEYFLRPTLSIGINGFSFW